MENENVTLDDIFSSLSDCVAFGCRPDEYQQRHNFLIRQIAIFLLKDHLQDQEGTEDP